MLKIKWNQNKGHDDHGNRFSTPVNQETVSVVTWDNFSGFGWTPEEALEVAGVQRDNHYSTFPQGLTLNIDGQTLWANLDYVSAVEWRYRIWNLSPELYPGPSIQLVPAIFPALPPPIDEKPEF